MKNEMKKILSLSLFLVLAIPLSVASAQMNGSGSLGGTNESSGKTREEIRQNTQGKKEEVKENVRNKQCETLTSREQTTLNRLEKRMETTQLRINERTSGYKERITQNDIAYEQRKENTQKARENMYKEMMEIATTQEQKDAVKQFEISVEVSATKKYTSLDNARSAYRLAQQTTTQEYEEALLKPYEVYMRSVESAMTSAVADCTGEEAIHSVRSTLRTKLKDARDTFRQDTTTLKNSVKTDLNEEKKVYTSAVSSANETYRAEVETSSDELKKILDIDSITVTVEI